LGREDTAGTFHAGEVEGTVIVGLDLALRSTGVAVDGVAQTWRKPDRSPNREWLQILHERFYYLLCDHYLAVVEGLPIYHRASTSVLGMVHGVFQLALAEAETEGHDPKVAVVPPASLKRYATGSGTASKQDMIDAAASLLGAKGLSGDEADALWLWKIGTVLDKGGEVPGVSWL
jgi:Holliday junction resolvasome RuvABC endonuclease subunit